MEQAITALLGPPDWIKGIAKETSNTSFGVGALKKDDKVVTTVYPSKYPEKIWSLLFPLTLSDKVYLYVDKVDRTLGEMIIALDLMGKRDGKIALKAGVEPSVLKNLTKDTVVENYHSFSENPGLLREELLGLSAPRSDGKAMVVVDQSFSVRGVGCVALGFVVSGEVDRHQEMMVLPGKKMTQVRSIQIQDRDFEKAPAGSRVGLALKNVEPDDVPRGSCLVPDASDLKEAVELPLSFKVSRYFKETLAESPKLHICSSLQFAPAQLKGLTGALREDGIRQLYASVSMESPIWYCKDSLFCLCYLESRSFRFFASGESI